METLRVGQLIRPSITITDRFGNPAQVDGAPVWSGPTSPTHGVVEPAPGGMSAVFRARGVGQGSITITADADLGEGVKTITGRLDYNILPAEAAVISVSAPPPEEDPTA